MGAQKPRTWTYRLGGAALRLVITLALLEVTCRLWFRQGSFAVHPAQEIAFDPVVGWKGKPGFHGEVFHGPLPDKIPYPVEVSINSDGFRDGEWDEKRAAAEAQHTTKVLFVGDSLVYGYANPVEHRLTEMTELLAALNGMAVTAFNAGIPAFGTSQEFRMLPALIERTNPDLVVFVAFHNDWAESALPYDHRFGPRVYKPYYTPDGELALFDTVPQRPSLRAARHGLGFLALWKAVDLVSARIDDLQWSRFNLPAWQPLGWYRYEELFAQHRLLDGYPQLAEAHRDARLRVRNLLQKAQELALRGGRKFLLFGPDSLGEDLPPALLADFVSFRDFARFQDFFPVYYDGHPNALWSWLLGARTLSRLSETPISAPLARAADLFQVPAALDLTTDRDFRYLFGDWSPPAPEGRYGTPTGAALLRAPAPAGDRATVTITFGRTAEELLSVRDLDWKELCLIPTTAASAQCTVTSQEGLVFLRFVPLGFATKKPLDSRAAITSLAVQ